MLSITQEQSERQDLSPEYTIVDVDPDFLALKTNVISKQNLKYICIKSIMHSICERCIDFVSIICIVAIKNLLK